MSNPGVICLVQTKIQGVRFCIEDNIGETIHVHFGHFRFDFTINEFIELADAFQKAMNDFVQIENFNIESMDPLFLFQISRTIPDIKLVKIEHINLNKLKVDTYNCVNIPIITSLKESRIVKALNGNTEENDKHEQINIVGYDNNMRLKHVRNNISFNNYSCNGSYIVLFNNQDVIRDGQHRAGCLYFDNPETSIPIMRIYYFNNIYNVTERPWILFLFYWPLKRIKKVIKIFYNKGKLRYMKYRFILFRCFYREFKRKV